MAAKNKIIYADKLQKAIVDDVTIKGRAFAAVMRHIQTAPAVDAVEVVRCKDCKYRKRPLFAGNGIYCVENRRHFELDDFCSYGERREGE